LPFGHKKMEDFIKSISTQEIEKITGEKPEKIKRWKKGITKVPESAIRLLKLYFNGEASGLLGKDWEGFYFKDALFYVPEWRRGFTPHEIRALFWKCQQIISLESELRRLKQEIERRDDEINALEIKADFYRRQVVLESRFGMILERSFS
jgi:hypothetical protein